VTFGKNRRYLQSLNFDLAGKTASSGGFRHTTGEPSIGSCQTPFKGIPGLPVGKIFDLPVEFRRVWGYDNLIKLPGKGERYERIVMDCAVCRRISAASALCAAQNGDFHMNARCLSGDRQKRQKPGADPDHRQSIHIFVIVTKKRVILS
jgi:hypothetical protein